MKDKYYFVDNQRKKKNNLSLGNSLERRSRTGEEKLQRVMPVYDRNNRFADTHADILNSKGENEK